MIKKTLWLNTDTNMRNFKIFNEAKAVSEIDCWDGYKKAGTKKGKGGKRVNNCVPEEASLCETCGKVHEGGCDESDTFKDDVAEARVAPSANLEKPMTRGSAADLKRSLNISVDGLDALAWKLQYQFIGVDPKAISELKAMYKQALKMQKSVAKAIDSAK